MIFKALIEDFHQTLPGEGRNLLKEGGGKEILD